MCTVRKPVLVGSLEDSLSRTVAAHLNVVWHLAMAQVPSSWSCQMGEDTHTGERK